MRFHITFTGRDNLTHTDRVNAPTRSGAIQAAAIKHNIAQGRVTSAVALPAPRPVVAERKPCAPCHGTGRYIGPHGENVRCLFCIGTGTVA